MNFWSIARWFLAFSLVNTLSCDPLPPTTDQKQSEAQEKIIAEGNAQVGMPGITNFRRRKLLKSIMEMCDSDTLTTYTYVFAENTGKFTFLCNSIGYGIPAATEFTSPQHLTRVNLQNGAWENVVLPQADPDGLFSPASADGTWVMCKDPNGPDVKPIYVEPRIMTSPFKMDEEKLQSGDIKTTSK